jgi:methylamine dehydrogenase heavy chain
VTFVVQEGSLHRKSPPGCGHLHVRVSRVTGMMNCGLRSWTERGKTVCVGLLVAAALAFSAQAELPPESLGKIERLPEPFHAHWVWVADLVLERVALVDLDSGRFLGLVNGGYGAVAPLFPSRRAELYLPASYYSRRTRGERTDVLEIYDVATLSLQAEVEVPAKRAIDAVALGHSALSDDDRFVAMFNWTPRTSLSIVDVEKRAFAGEIDVPGCSLVYSAGPRRFLSLCADGAALVVTLAEDGREAGKERTQAFFDPRKDPVTEKAVRYRDRWLFVSFDGYVYPVDASGAQIRFDEAWSLLTDAERAASWRIGGLQHLAVHEASGRLYSLVHRGGPDTHKDPGDAVWVYDLRSRQRLQRIKMRNPGLTIYGTPVELGRSGFLKGLSDWLIDRFAPPVVTHITVTQDDAPRLVTASQYTGSLGVYDGISGSFLGRVQPTGWTTDLLLAPWGGAPGTQ